MFLIFLFKLSKTLSEQKACGRESLNCNIYIQSRSASVSGQMSPGEMTLTALKSIAIKHMAFMISISHLLKALIGVDVVQPLELVVVQHQGGRVQDQLGRGAAQLLQVSPGDIKGVGIRPRALNSFLA